jgi:hypothetical protein
MIRLTDMQPSTFMPRRTRSLKDTIHLSTGAGVTWTKLSLTFPIARRRRMGLSRVIISAGCSKWTVGESQYTMERRDNLRSLPDGGSNTFDRAGPYVTDGEDAAPARFQRLTVDGHVDARQHETRSSPAVRTPTNLASPVRAFVSSGSFESVHCGILWIKRIQMQRQQADCFSSSEHTVLSVVNNTEARKCRISNPSSYS